MNRRILELSFPIFALAILSACNGIDKLPGTSSSSSAITVQIVQPPPTPTIAGQPVGLVANALNDSKNGGVTWSCAPAGACGTFSPTTTGYEVTTQYMPPIAPPNGPITTNLAYSVTITATSVTDNSQSANVTVNIGQQYAFVLNGGYGGWGAAGSITLDGYGNVVAGEADYECPGCATEHVALVPGIGSSYSLDATGHGYLSLSLAGDIEVHGITATSNSHLVIAEEDQNDGITYGDVGSMDLQTAGPSFSGSQVSGGYSFTASGYSGAMGENGSWGGIFTADGTATASTTGNITGGIFDENVGNNGGGPGYNSEPSTAGGTGAVGASGLPITGTYTAPDANGRGIITLDATPDTIAACSGNPLPTCTQTQYVYYLVAPEVLRLVVFTNDGDGAYTGSAYGQGSLATAANDTNSALTGGFVFSYFGYGDNNNGGDSSAAAGQFAADESGSGTVVSGVMDFNVADGGVQPPGSTPNPTTVTTDISLIGSTIAISGSPRGTLTTPSGQIYNVYLTDPNLNLLDPNNTTATGGALLFEANNASVATPYGNAIGLMIPQADAGNATLAAGNYAIVFSQQSNVSNCCANDSGYTGDFTVTTAAPGTFTGEGDFESAASYSTATPAVNPLSGTFTADGSHLGRFTGTITTTPPFPIGPFGSTTPGTEQFSYYLANGSQGFIIETSTTAPTFGTIEAQPGLATAAQERKRLLPQSRSSSSSDRPVKNTNQHTEILGRSR
jgi:hypothetical protein